MDDALKARLIGAAVLVLLAVLLIPELLSGRKTVEPVAEEAGPRGSRTFTIELGGGSGQSVRTPTTVTPATSPPSGDAAPAAAQAAIEPTPTPQPATITEQTPEPVLEPAPEPAPELVARPAPIAKPSAVEPEPPPVAAPGRGGWAVQVGAFGSAGTAAKLVRELSAAGYPAFESPVARAGNTLHRVRVGPEADKAGAEQLARRLKDRGLPATIVQND
jgi:DedD protein